MRTHLRLVKPPKEAKWGATAKQRQQRELAWLVYIAEGHLANLRVASTAFMNGRQKAAHRAAILVAAGQVTAARRELSCPA